MASLTLSAPPIPFDRVTHLVRQLSHDVRNGLNAVDLQATLLSEILEEGEARLEAMRLRDTIGRVTRTLEKITSDFQGFSLDPIACEAGAFLEDARLRLEKTYGERMREVTWGVDVGEAWIKIDLEAILEVMDQVLQNAFEFAEGDGRIEFLADATADAVRFRLVEGKLAEPENLSQWGREPCMNVRSGRYGLGLFRAHRIAEEHGGELCQSFDADRCCLVTTLSIPTASAHG